MHVVYIINLKKQLNMDSMKKEIYKKPTIEIIEMEMEGGLCAGTVIMDCDNDENKLNYPDICGPATDP